MDVYSQEAPLVDMMAFPEWVIQDDENFLIINKPGWLVCHPSKNGPLSSLVGAVREYTHVEKLHLVARLDRET
ncbi:MAG: RluA family pseudouridine synthase, partial [Verrucomicrobiota bacterium]